jgi:hypothetical protein
MIPIAQLNCSFDARPSLASFAGIVDPEAEGIRENACEET